MENTISVLDKGYVRLINTMGTDLDVVNAARVSFNKEVDTLSNNDTQLIDFLIKNKHDSVLRHCAMSFEIYAPLMVARQWYKHAVGSSHVEEQLGWNESSRRYITEEPVFYTPDTFLLAAENKKQGSAGFMSKGISQQFVERLETLQSECMSVYNHALELGMAAEQARLFLPAYGMYIRWRWTVSLNALMHFLSLRKDISSQDEIQKYAKAVEIFVIGKFPATAASWRVHRG